MKQKIIKYGTFRICCFKTIWYYIAIYATNKVENVNQKLNFKILLKNVNMYRLFTQRLI